MYLTRLATLCFICGITKHSKKGIEVFRQRYKRRGTGLEYVSRVWQMRLIMKEDTPFDVGDIALFASSGIVFQPRSFVNLIE